VIRTVCFVHLPLIFKSSAGEREREGKKEREKRENKGKDGRSDLRNEGLVALSSLSA